MAYLNKILAVLLIIIFIPLFIFGSTIWSSFNLIDLDLRYFIIAIFIIILIDIISKRELLVFLKPIFNQNGATIFDKNLYSKFELKKTLLRSVLNWKNLLLYICLGLLLYLGNNLDLSKVFHLIISVLTINVMVAVSVKLALRGIIILGYLNNSGAYTFVDLFLPQEIKDTGMCFVLLAISYAFSLPFFYIFELISNDIFSEVNLETLLVCLITYFLFVFALFSYSRVLIYFFANREILKFKN